MDFSGRKTATAGVTIFGDADCSQAALHSALQSMDKAPAATKGERLYAQAPINVHAPAKAAAARKTSGSGLF